MAETSWEHPVRLRLASGQPVLALTITTSNVEAAALAATLGFHFLWVEMEHSPITLETLRLTDRIARGRRVEPLHLHRHAPMLCDDPAVTLPHLDVVSLTDGGMETTLIFHHGLDLPHFAAFTLLANEQGRDALSTYYDTYLDVAEEYDHPIVLDTATWRANTDWGELLGYSADALDEANRDAVALVRAAVSRHSARVVVSGAIGPRGDGYVAGLLMSAHDAQGYHGPQVRSLAAAGVDVVSAITMTYADEAIGIVRAAAGAGVPSVVSFTVETDGRLPSGQTLADAVAAVDAETARAWGLDVPPEALAAEVPDQLGLDLMKHAYTEFHYLSRFLPSLYIAERREEEVPPLPW